VRTVTKFSTTTTTTTTTTTAAANTKEPRELSRYSYTGWAAGVLVPASVRDLSLLHSVRTCCGGHPSSYPLGTESFLRGGKAAGS
jgi:hypothetical protein